MMDRITHTPKAQDIRPILWRSATNSWGKAEEVRDQIGLLPVSKTPS